MIIHECDYEPPHSHEWPDDWEFGGADNQDPRTDQRWRPTVYVYLNEKLEEVWHTVAPLCDDQAIDEFTKHAGIGAVYLQARRPGSRELELLPWQYQADEDLVVPFGV